MLLDICLVYLPGPVFCFFKIEVTESFEIPKIRPVARVPVQSIANFTTCLRTSGSYAFLVYSSTKLYRSHAGLLHRYTCFPALLCPFLLTLSLPQCGHLIVNVFVAIPLPTFPFSLFSFFVTSLQFLKDITARPSSLGQYPVSTQAPGHSGRRRCCDLPRPDSPPAPRRS